MPSPVALASEEHVRSLIRRIERQIDAEQDAGFRAALINGHLTHWEMQRKLVAQWMQDGDERSAPPMSPVFNVGQCDHVLSMLRDRLKRIEVSIRMRLMARAS